MPYSIGDSKNDLAGIGHGRSVNKITNYNSAARRAAMNLLRQIDPEETIKIGQVTLYDDVTDYAAPVDLKEKKLIDVRPQVGRRVNDNLSNRMNKEFDLKKWDNWLTVVNDGGTKYLRVSKRLSPGAVAIDPMDAITNWSVSGDASNLSVDTLYSVSNGNSLKFDLAAAGASGILVNSTIFSKDLSAGSNTYAFFLWVYLPSATAITSVKLRFGNSAASYWEATGTIQLGTQRLGWNLFRFDWPAGAGTGAPSSSNITYIRLEFIYAGVAVSGVRVDKLFASLPKVWDVEYYSKFLFSASGTWQDTVTDDNTTVNLDSTSYILFLNEVALAGLQQIQGKDAIADRTYFYKQLYGDAQNNRGLYEEYRKDNPSQGEKVTSTYYTNLRFKRK